MTTERDDEEQQLRIDLMTIQIEHFKQQVRWEPWKAMAIAFGAGAAAMGAVIALLTAVLRALGKG